MREAEPIMLEMLIRHELAIKQLYEIFATMFTNCRDFWQRLAGDEQRHADRLGTLRSESTTDKWLLHNDRLKPQAIKSSIGYVEHQIVRAHEGNFSLRQALSIARDLESALLEKQFSKLVISDTASDETRSILMALAAETREHQKALVEAIDNEGR